MRKLFIVAILSLILAVPSKTAQALDSQVHTESTSEYEKVVMNYGKIISKLSDSNLSQQDRVYLVEFIRQVERNRKEVLHSISDCPRGVFKQFEKKVTIEVYRNAASHLKTRFSKYL